MTESLLYIDGRLNVKDRMTVNNTEIAMYDSAIINNSPRNIIKRYPLMDLYHDMKVNYMSQTTMVKYDFLTENADALYLCGTDNHPLRAAPGLHSTCLFATNHGIYQAMNDHQRCTLLMEGAFDYAAPVVVLYCDNIYCETCNKTPPSYKTKTILITRATGSGDYYAHEISYKSDGMIVFSATEPVKLGVFSDYTILDQQYTTFPIHLFKLKVNSTETVGWYYLTFNGLGYNENTPTSLAELLDIPEEENIEEVTMATTVNNTYTVRTSYGNIYIINGRTGDKTKEMVRPLDLAASSRLSNNPDDYRMRYVYSNSVESLTYGKKVAIDGTFYYIMDQQTELRVSTSGVPGWGNERAEFYCIFDCNEENGANNFYQIHGLSGDTLQDRKDTLNTLLYGKTITDICRLVTDDTVGLDPHNNGGFWGKAPIAIGLNCGLLMVYISTANIAQRYPVGNSTLYDTLDSNKSLTDQRNNLYDKFVTDINGADDEITASNRRFFDVAVLSTTASVKQIIHVAWDNVIYIDTNDIIHSVLIDPDWVTHDNIDAMVFTGNITLNGRFIMDTKDVYEITMHPYVGSYNGNIYADNIGKMEIDVATMDTEIRELKRRLDAAYEMIDTLRYYVNVLNDRTVPIKTNIRLGAVKFDGI